MNKELFNPKTVERFLSKIKPSYKQKIAAKSWLYLLEQGKLKKEKLNYIKRLREKKKRFAKIKRKYTYLNQALRLINEDFFVSKINL